MSFQVLIVQPDRKAAHGLIGFFSRRGDKIWRASNKDEALVVLKKHPPHLALIDLHLSDDQSIHLITVIRRNYPDTQIIATNKHPDLRHEILAREQGVFVFLREPFTPRWITNALLKLEAGAPALDLPAFVSLEKAIPKVKIPMRLKITLPYAMLALIFSLALAYLVSRFVIESIQERYTNQLVDASVLAADLLVQEEDRLLNTLRLVANLEGLADAIRHQDAESLRALVLPVAINYSEDAIEILDANGVSQLSLRRSPGADPGLYTSTKGEPILGGYEFVSYILQGTSDSRGDKFAGMVRESWGDLLYVAGPIFDSERKLTAVVLVGASLTNLVHSIQQSSLAQITLYSIDGFPLASTLPEGLGESSVKTETVEKVILTKGSQGNIRSLTIGSSNYSEILSTWKIRDKDDQGILGVSLAHNFVFRPSLFNRLQAFSLIVLAFAGVFMIGILLAKQITQPLAKVVYASTEVAKGNLEVRVPPVGDDEIAVVAHAFNYMVSGLQEGSIYRDLLGRTVSPEVRDALRQSFAKGDLRLEGQSTIASVLMTDIRGFTSFSEKEEPTTILTWLNEYFGTIVPVVTSEYGVVDKFEGDAMLAFFGILPTLLSPEESTYLACKASVTILEKTNHLNLMRAERREPALITGVSIHTGPLIVGGLGASDRLNYTVIGDTVNTTQRMQSVTRGFGESGIVVSESALTALASHRVEFNFEPLGEHDFPGKLESLWLYRMWTANKKK